MAVYTSTVILAAADAGLACGGLYTGSQDPAALIGRAPATRWEAVHDAAGLR